MISWAFLVMSDLCLVFFDEFWVSILYLIISQTGFAYLMTSIWRVIDWRQLNLGNTLILTVVTGFNLYLLHVLLQAVAEFIEPTQLLCFYIYGALGTLCTMISGVSYMQLDRTDNEHFLIIPYAYLISNAFLVIAIFTIHDWFFILSRMTYILLVSMLAYQMVKRIQYPSTARASILARASLSKDATNETTSSQS
ncbi:hypothetical protein [Nonlabens xiamenensis]|uniref:hypothetical protein n=1 Tax=Nonlabens xiamenensis TaxID=2341043 RepID=UPI000F608054|nr:hypothetical protein [Nonlabens xiamenensis]